MEYEGGEKDGEQVEDDEECGRVGGGQHIPVMPREMVRDRERGERSRSDWGRNEK